MHLPSDKSPLKRCGIWARPPSISPLNLAWNVLKGKGKQGFDVRKKEEKEMPFSVSRFKEAHAASPCACQKGIKRKHSWCKLFLSHEAAISGNGLALSDTGVTLHE